ncbi:hypothetical protein Tco_0700508 [Tanacetum coccineum]
MLTDCMKEHKINQKKDVLIDVDITLRYEVAQSNAAWILDKFGEESMCMGESDSGLCIDSERHHPKF